MFFVVDKMIEFMGYFYCFVEYYIFVKILIEKYVIFSLIKYFECRGLC